MSPFVHDLSVGEPAADAPVVILIHGITANALCWPPLVAELARRHGPGGLRILAPDLQGRADSPAAPDHAGLDVHVADMLALAQTAPAPPLVVGHSMGAMVTALLAAAHPQAIRGALLIDGGLSFPVPPGVDVDAVMAAMLGPSLARIAMTFPDEQALIDFVATNPALRALLAGPEREAALTYLGHDVVHGADGLVRSSCVAQAINADGRDVLLHPRLPGAARAAVEAGVPMEFLWARRGLFDEPQGLYDEGRLAALALPEALRVTHVPDTNHFSIVFGAVGIAAIADAIDRLLPA